MDVFPVSDIVDSVSVVKEGEMFRVEDDEADDIQRKVDALVANRKEISDESTMEEESSLDDEEVEKLRKKIRGKRKRDDADENGRYEPPLKRMHEMTDTTEESESSSDESDEIIDAYKFPIINTDPTFEVKQYQIVFLLIF